MIKTPNNTIRNRYGIPYDIELKHIISIRNKYKIHTDRTELNKKYNIKQYKKE